MSSQNSDRPNSPLIDLSDLRNSLGAAADQIIPTFLASYLQEGANNVAILGQASPASDLDQLTRLVHNLKSSSATLGIASFSALCKRAEEAARQRDTAALFALLPEVVSAFRAVQSEGSALLQRLTGG